MAIPTSESRQFDDNIFCCKPYTELRYVSNRSAFCPDPAGREDSEKRYLYRARETKRTSVGRRPVHAVRNTGIIIVKLP